MLPQPVWQELMHKFMLAEALAHGLIPAGNPARQLAEKPALVKKLAVYRDKIRALVETGLGFEPCTRQDVLETAPGLQDRYGLLTNDSVLLAVALRLKADALVTADAAFKPVTETCICAPTDIRPPRTTRSSGE
jgi:predicted nucleic acid-binding protein